MPMITQFQENQKTMSTRVIADLTEKRHDHVKRDVENMLGQLGLDIPKFGGIYFDAQNRQQTEYLLDEELTMTLVTGYNIVLRNRVIKRWKELEDKALKPVELSRMELIQLALAAEQENQALKDHVAVLAPKAQALDTIADTSNTYCIRECAKTIGIKESELIQLLIDKKWVYRDASKKLQPMAQYTLNGVFANRTSPVIKNHHDGQERVFLHMRVTAFGLTRIAGLVEKSRMKGVFVA
ncbi:phage antirepressor KilAC domain-containing protein [Acinetobacter sp. WCHAc060042]|uniref:phage antirepressor KilAC domain-containing protein n=1 Tax=Acinetobacter sp. WCHAc060042 TaxID=2213016 RepID=UPI000DA660C1|nr:phage regulatory protein/antirepressor Ant [Acinetobacter sp. WCHAc060042]